MEGGATLRLTSRLSWITTTLASGRSTDPRPGQIRRSIRTAQALDRTSDINLFEALVKVSDATTLVGRASLQKDEFEHVLGPRSQATSNRYDGGVKFSGVGVFSGALLGGLRASRGGVSEAVAADSTWTLDGRLGMPFLLGSHLDLRAVRDYSYSVFDSTVPDAPPRSTYIATRYSAMVSFSLPLDLIMRTGYRYETAEYPTPTTAPFGNPRTHGVDFSLLKAFGDSFHVGGTLQYEKRDAQEGFRYEGYRYGLAASGCRDRECSPDVTTLFVFAVAMGVLISFREWHLGVVWALVIGCLQDPVRKLVPGHPPIMAISALPIWCAFWVSAIFRNQAVFQSVAGRFPSLAQGIRIFLVCLIPPMFLAFGYGPESWRMAALGGFGYLAPLFTGLVAFAFVRRPLDLSRLLGFYGLFTAALMIGTLMEQFGGAQLGGAGHEALSGSATYKYYPGHALKLMAGFYRSPDIMAWHAAMLVMVSLTLALAHLNARASGPQRGLGCDCVPRAAVRPPGRPSARRW